jgi:hypothetical protein
MTAGNKTTFALVSVSEKECILIKFVSEEGVKEPKFRQSLPADNGRGGSQTHKEQNADM